MARKTAEERAREFDDAKYKKPKVLTRKGVAIPEVLNLRVKENVSRKHEIAGQYRVYCLLDPRNQEPFYVGITTVGEAARLNQHESEARHPIMNPCSAIPYIRELHKLGHKSLFKTIEKTGDTSRELYWITKLSRQGIKLVNIRLV